MMTWISGDRDCVLTGNVRYRRADERIGWRKTAPVLVAQVEERFMRMTWCAGVSRDVDLTHWRDMRPTDLRMLNVAAAPPKSNDEAAA